MYFLFQQINFAFLRLIMSTKWFDFTLEKNFNIIYCKGISLVFQYMQIHCDLITFLVPSCLLLIGGRVDYCP